MYFLYFYHVCFYSFIYSYMYLSFMYMYSFLCFVIFCLFLSFLSYMPFYHVFLAYAILFLSICLSYIHIIYVFLSCLYLFIYFLYFHHVPTIRLCMTIICSHHIILYSYVPIIHVLSITFYDISDHLLSYLIISYDLYLSYNHNPIFISFHISCTHLYILHFLYFSLFYAYYI